MNHCFARLTIKKVQESLEEPFFNFDFFFFNKTIWFIEESSLFKLGFWRRLLGIFGK
jgi:hypothetical protein